MTNITIALAGNPNCGKTTLFNALTGASQYVGNWPGVTVERKAGKLNEYPEIEVQDLPGIYSLSPYTLEEVISRDYLVRDEPSVIIDLVDATNLERNLYLTTQLQELGRPIIVALNMADLMARRGITIDKTKLAKALHCPVVEISALKGTGLKELVELAVKTAGNPEAKPASRVHFDDTVEKALSRIAEYLSCDPDLKRWYAIKLFERDPKVVEHLHLDGQTSQAIEQIILSVEEEMDDDSESIITSERYAAIAGIVKESQTKKHMGLSISDKIDRIVTHRILALPIFFLVMWAVYYLSINTVGDWGTGWANDTFFGEIVGPWMDGFIGTAPAGIGLVAFIAVILSMIVLFPLLLRRLHDLNLKGAWMYLTILLFTSILIICTVLYQTLKAAKANPAVSIKSE
ncbi:MAG: ferrous iron transporter B [Akkermansia sp.]|nr:ferrous iron transporter B [Akkermansia sp.]